MASTIKLKNSTTTGNSPSSLETGEVAINVADGNLFYGSASAVLQNFVIDELEVKGNLTAQQYIVSSSVTYTTQSFSSGSTIFGDTQDDTHLFTGSISVTGSITATSFIGNGSGLTNLPSQTDENFTTADHSKLDGIETSADVTDTANVTSAGALMDSELSDLAAVKAINQGLTTTSDVIFNEITASGDISASGFVIGNRGQFSSQVEVNGEVALSTTDSATTGQVFADTQITKIKIGKAGSITSTLLESNVTASGDISASGTITANSFNGIFDGALSSSAQIASDISGSFTAASGGFSTRVSTLEGAGYVDTSGTPTDNQIAIFTDADTIEGTSELTYDGTTLNIDGQVDIDEARSSGAVVDITNSYSGLMSADHFALRVVGGQANSTPGSQIKAYGGHFTAGNTNAQNPDSIALFTQGHEDGAPNSYAAIFSGSAGGVVGINTMEPTVELDIVGDVKVSSNITASGNISASGTITGNSIVGTLATAAQTNITSVGILGSLTLGGDIDMDGNTLNMNAGEITDAASVRSLQFGSTTDQDLTITSDGNITFKLDDDNDETSQSFKFQNDNTEIASLNESGDLQLNGNITASGNISASGVVIAQHITASNNIRVGGDIICNNITVAEDITSVGDDIILKDNLVVSSSAGVVSFRGTAGGSNEGITYLDSAGSARYALILPGSDVVALTNRAADGIVQIRVSNASGGGSSNEITVAEFDDDKITHKVKSEIRLEKTSNTDADYNGDVVFFGGTTSMTAGRIYHFKSDGTWELANPNAVATSDGLLAVALGAASDTNGMLLKGMVTLDHDPGAVGDVLYLDEQQVSSAYGAATSGAPAGTGDVVRIIGYCLDASNGQIYFDPSKDHIVHA